jgi:hypothetical protein
VVRPGIRFVLGSLRLESRPIRCRTWSEIGFVGTQLAGNI